MALFGIDEETKLKKQLNKSARRGNFLLIGGVLGILVLVVIFTMVDFGSLFKGNLDGNLGKLNDFANQTGTIKLEDVTDGKLPTDIVGGKLSDGTLEDPTRFEDPIRDLLKKECYERDEFKGKFITTLKLETVPPYIVPSSAALVATDKRGEFTASEGDVKYYAIKQLYDAVKAKDDSKVAAFTKAVDDIYREASKNSCSLTNIKENTRICDEIINTLTYAQYQPGDYNKTTKESLGKMMNINLSCCALENKIGYIIDMDSQDYKQGFTCQKPVPDKPAETQTDKPADKTEDKPADKPEETPAPIVTHAVDKTVFSPSEGEKILFTYKSDQDSKVKLLIKDASGKSVHEFADDVSKGLMAKHIWDGKDSTGKIVAIGAYGYTFTATSATKEGSPAGGTITVTEAQVSCTDNQLADSATKICISGEWVLCTEGGEFDGTKSLDKKLTCAGGKWIDLSNPPPKEEDDDEKTDCVENNLMMNGKRICKQSIWLPCTEANEGEKSSDGLKACNNGFWVKISNVASTQTPPPPPSGDIKISKASAFPIGFNPLINETKITYAITAKAEIEIRILTKSGVTMATIVDNKTLNAGEYFVWWDGTSSSGKTVNPATYEYKITAKDPTSGTVKDVKKGVLNVVYAKLADFETPAPQPPQTNNQSAATMAMTNATSGSTASTGPGVLLYFLFPVGSFIITRRKKY